MRLTPTLLPPLAGLLAGCASVSLQSVYFDQLQPATATIPAGADTLYIVSTDDRARISDSTVQATDPALAEIMWTQEVLAYSRLADPLAKLLNEGKYIGARRLVGKYGQTPAARLDSLRRLYGHAPMLLIGRQEAQSWFDIDRSHAPDEVCVAMPCVSAVELTLLVDGRANSLPTRRDTLIFTTCQPSLALAAKHLPQPRDKYREMWSNVADHIESTLVPWWQRTRRDLFVSTNYDSQEAALKAQADNWHAARDDWQRIYATSQSPAERARAAINVAVSFEREDNANDAALWASMALDVIEAADQKTQQHLDEETTQAQGIFRASLRRQDQLILLNSQMN